MRFLLRCLMALVVALFVTWTTRASASPQDRFTQGLTDCLNKASGTTLSCNVCGVSFDCSGDAASSTCSWGGIKFDVNNSSQNGAQIQSSLKRGYQIYCLNSGGSVVAAAAPAGLQSRAIATALRSLSSRTEKASYGGSIEYTSIKDADGATYGLALPLSMQVSPNLTLGGSVLAGKAPGLTQVGANVRPTWILDESRAPGSPRTLLAAGVPLQLVMMAGEGLSTSFGYLVGGTVLGGIVTEDGTWGAGVSVDAFYAGGIQVPSLAAVRYSFGDPLRFAIQPAISTDLTAISDSLAGNLLAGVEIGDSILGLQVFAHGAGNYTLSLGVSNVARPLASTTAERPKPTPAPLHTSDPSDARRGEADLAAGPKREGDACGAHSECAGTLACVAGKCVAPRRYTPGMAVGPSDHEAPPAAAAGPRGEECKTDSACAGGDVCEAGFCVAPEDAP